MRKGLLAAFLLFASVITLHAQPARTINLNEAVDVALENNFQLEVAQNNLALTEDRITGEKADFFPSVSANFGATKSIGNQFIPGSDRFVNRTVNFISGGLSANITLFSGFANINSLRSTEYSQSSEEQNVQWVRETIIFETATRFLQLLLDKELLEIAKENLGAALQTLEQVQIQTDVGSRPIADLYNQQATVANNRLLITDQQNAVEFSRLSLVRILQIDPLEEYRFIIPETNIEGMAYRSYNLEQLVAAALENRSDLQSEKYNIQSIKYQLEVARGGLYPTLSFGANSSSDFSDQGFLPGSDELIPFRDQFFDNNLRFSFGFNLSIPIFNSFDRRLNVAAQQITYKNAELALADTRLQVIQEVKQAYNDYRSVIERLEATQAALRAAEKAYEAEQARYEVGAGTLIQLSEANARFVEARSNRTQAVYNFIFQKKLLDYYLGKLNQDISFN